MMKVNANIKKNSSEKKSRHSIATNIQPRSLHKRDNPLDRVPRLSVKEDVVNA
tara:strand:- start:532 stop:690 length:159 start_codon:yes stop_codon:yes gene_type:complete